MAIDYTNTKHRVVDGFFPKKYLMRLSEIKARGYPDEKSFMDMLKWGRELPKDEFIFYEYPEYRAAYIFDKRYKEMIMFHQNKTNVIYACENDENKRVIWSKKKGCTFNKVGLGIGWNDRDNWKRRLHARTLCGEWDRAEEAKQALANLPPGYVMFEKKRYWMDRLNHATRGWINHIDKETMHPIYHPSYMVKKMSHNIARKKINRLAQIRKEKQNEED